MKPFKLAVVAIAFCGLLLTALTSSVAQNSVNYQPIPQGFDFPANQADLINFRDTQNVPAMRRHTWLVFAGMTQPTAGGEAVWETWYSGKETFQLTATPQGVRRIQRNFEIPRQFKAPHRGHPQAVGAALASFTLYNREARGHIRTNNFFRANNLTQLNQAFLASTPIEQREITPFPREAVVLKTTWWIVKKSGLTVMPIWDPIPTGANQPARDYPTWRRAVAVDPSRTQIPPDEKVDVTFGGQPRPGSHVVPLANFYYFKMTAADIAAIQALGPFIQGGNSAQDGDYLVLIGLHSTTKEIPDWVWATFWWHDKPDDGPFAADRPSEVKGVWRNYLMDTSYSMDIPKESDGNPNACFNPWLEARFTNGVNSNCMTCHQHSVWPPPDGSLPVTRGALPPNDQFFAGKMKLDFLWSIGDNAQ